MMYLDIHNYIYLNIKSKDWQSIVSNLQPNCCLKVDSQKLDQHTGGKWLIHEYKIVARPPWLYILESLYWWDNIFILRRSPVSLDYW